MVPCRYFPQVYLNFQRKSTIGWSVSNALTDMSGGLFSLAQQSLDAYALRVRASGCLCTGKCWPCQQSTVLTFGRAARAQHLPFQAACQGALHI